MSYLGRSAKLSRKTQEKVSFLATAGQTSKTGLSYVPTFVEVSVNGILLTDVTDYTATSGSSITFTVALELNDEVTVVSLKTFALADHYTKTQTDSAVSAAAAALVDSSPAALNTLNELAAALGDDANYATTTTNAIATKAPLASPVFTGNVAVGTSSITNHGYDRQVQVGGSSNAHLGIKGGSNEFGLAYNGGALLRNYANSPMSFWTNNTERMRIDSSGHAIIPAGVTLGTAAGVYSAANTLDDYEEGTWTPTDTVGGGTLNATASHYTKIGNVVNLWTAVSWTGVGSAGSTLQMDGLPFTISNGQMGGSVMFDNFTASTNAYNVAVFLSGTSIKLYQSISNNSWEPMRYNNNIGVGDSIYLNATYRTDQ